MKMWPVLLVWLVCECQMYRSWRCSPKQQPAVTPPQQLLEPKQSQEEFFPNQVDFSNAFCWPSAQGWDTAELLAEATASHEEMSQGWGEIEGWSSSDVLEIPCEGEKHID